MKTKLYKTIDKLLTYLLGVLGLSACDSLICEYGSPHATYQITGKVTDKSTGKAIPNIQITFSHSCDTIYTDNKGEYGYGINGFIAYDTLEIKAEDIDGAANGGMFASDSAQVIFTEADKTSEGNSNWDKGSYAKTINFTLAPQTTGNKE